MKLRILLFFGELVHCQFSILDHEPDPDPEETYRLIGEIIGSYKNNKNLVSKATPESSYQNNRYVLNFRISVTENCKVWQKQAGWEAKIWSWFDIVCPLKHIKFHYLIII